MINFSDISVIVQGAIDKELTPKCLNSIRKYLPCAEIILSTWENSDTSGLDYDKLVLNQDPGCFKHDFAVYNKPRSMNNFNRQLVSAKNGVFKASRQYCLKLRSDLILNNSNFLKYWDKYNKQNEEYKIFKHRVLCSSIYSREYSCQSGTGLPTPFHPSDFWFFGLTEDLKDYFGNCPLQDKEEGSNWNFKYPARCPYITPLWRYAPEQWFCINWVKKYYPDVQFEDWSDWNEENIELSNNILYNNFMMLGFEQSGIYSKKHLGAENIKSSIQGLITFEHFQKQYQKYCDVTFKPYKAKKDYKYKLNQHFNRLINPFLKLKSWISEIFSVLYYSLAVVITGWRKKQ
ncbi:MAG: WavE lipopolysaccharide synthesis family protein [Candidatus Gastranaerophilales bacterium]|nr:WavE lipopolysaccharide synthesis family protein [Candidatus Gastranaerophilales bacterium]